MPKFLGLRWLPAAFSLFAIFQFPARAQSYAIQTIAGSTTIKDGIPGASAFLRDPAAVVADSSGNIYIADRADSRVRKVGRDGLISTVAGTGIPGHLNNGGPATQAQLDTPFILAIDKNNLYIAEYFGSLVRKLDLTTGILTTVAGNGKSQASALDGTKALQSAIDPEGLGIDSKGNLIIADGLNNRIRKVAPDGSITTIAGTSGCGDNGDNLAATSAQICFPTQLALDSADNIFFVDYGNTRVRRIDSKSGIIGAYLGYGYPFSDGDGQTALNTSVAYPDALAIDSAGNLYVSENCRIRFVPAGGAGTVRTVAGNATVGFSGDKGSAIAAKLAFPTGIYAFVNGDLLLADNGNFRIRKVTSGTIDTIVGAAIVDGAPALTSLFNGPSGVTGDSAGNIIIADTFNHRIRKLTAATGTVSTIAGTGTAGSLEGRINSPEDVAVDSKGLIYFADTLNDRIYQIQPDGTPKIFAGGNGTGFSGDGSFAKNARINTPVALVIDKNDVLYFSDSGNHRVRKVTTDGLIQPVAGNGNPGFGGDGGSARSAGLSPRGLAIDADGALYIADMDNVRVRRVDLASGNITTVAGNGTIGNAGDGGKATDAYLYSPMGIAVDNQHNLLIADQYASVLRRVNLTTGIITTVAGTGKPDTSAESGAAIATSFTPSRLFVEKSGTILVSDSYNDRIRRLTALTARTLSINSGDTGSGVAGTKLAVSAKVTDSNGYAIQGQTVSYSVTSGDATLTSSTASTGIDGVAGVQVILGTAIGPVTVRADSLGLTSVTFNLVVTAPTIVAPIISAVVGAPQSVPPVTTVSKNATALVLLGTPLSAAPPLGPTPYATNVATTCVTIAGIPAPISFVTTSMIGIIVPDVPVGPQPVIVTNACGTGNDVASAPFSVTVAPSSPEFVYSLKTPEALVYVTAVDTATQTPVGTPASTPATQGESISISAVGLGDTNPHEPIGDVSADMAGVTGAVIVTLAGNPLPPEAVLFTGLPPNTTPGLYRIDIIVPVDAPLGDQPVTIQIGDAVSPAGMLTISAPSLTQSSRDSRKIEKDEIRQLRKRR